MLLLPHLAATCSGVMLCCNKIGPCYVIPGTHARPCITGPMLRHTRGSCKALYNRPHVKSYHGLMDGLVKLETSYSPALRVHSIQGRKKRQKRSSCSFSREKNSKIFFFCKSEKNNLPATRIMKSVTGTKKHKTILQYY